MSVSRQWGLSITCLTCGGALEHTNSTTNGVLALTIATCTSCNRSYELTTRMRVFQSQESARRAEHRRRVA